MRPPRRNHPPQHAADVTPRRADTRLLPTLLDRLRDDAPHRATETPEDYVVTRTQMRDIVQRDLAFLLNTTNMEDLIDRERHPHAAASTVNFGVPPLAGTFITSRKWADIEQIIRRAIRDFEPRLIPETLVVSPRQAAGANCPYNILMFEVRGMIEMDPYPLEFMVQSSLDLETSRLSMNAMRVT
ncbi:type VI secretion system baseplate subunit TssE [Burkholderia sp. 4701]|nr:type VI secretion system baseplate subunit TssE [Burkholderia sp. 4701]MXN80768.1 type VI secretion system baseplate subunit TssE [Burkholderia sp. 4812]